jgi:hypothetical protein
MKKNSIVIITLVISAFVYSSCNGADNSKDQVNESEQTVSEKIEPEQAAPIETEVNQVEVDAKSMAHLSCEAQKNISEGQKAGLTREEVKVQNDPLNAEMTQISQRFEKEYKNNEKKDEFQRILQEELKKCNNQ